MHGSQCFEGCLCHLQGLSSPRSLLDPEDEDIMILQNIRNHYTMIQCHIPEDLIPQQHCCEKLKADHRVYLCLL